jgi:BirA family biotin operon repressor/biotin-[acetyl-CoA-carboxylase] ligase
MDFRLGPVAAARGYRLAAYETIGSTNAEALARAGAGDPGGLWIVSAHQSAGLGRRGRSWQTPAGNLAASLLLVARERPALPPTFGFVAGLAVVRAIEAVAARGRADLRLKWPNDVLLGGAKLAGILLQSVTLSGGGAALAVGIGVNVHHAPADVPYPATALAGAGFDVSPAALFAALSDAWVEEAERFADGRGFAETRARWLARAAGIGEPVAVSLGRETVRGRFETIDAEGRLLVRIADGGARAVAAGDVHFGQAASETAGA